MTAELESPEAWMAKTQRRSAIRLLVLGVALLLGGGVWALSYWDHGVGSSPITYVRVFSVLVLGIGGGIGGAGTVLLLRYR